MFKNRFKYYKQKCPPPDLQDVLDFRDENSIENKVVEKEPLQYDSVHDNTLKGFFKPVREWKIYEIKNRKDVIFIKNPWTSIGQRYWIARCLSDYTKRPNKLNLDVHSEVELTDIENWWSNAQRDEYQCGGEKGLMRKLRWATLGYHHNWDTKVYCEENKSEFPGDLWLINRYIAEVVGGWNDYNAQAAIVNFYHPDSTLSGHQDKSEHNMEAPLLSFSFGLTALFLIGGSKIDDDPAAMFLDSGDIVIMFGESRQSYHAVPRIMAPDVRPVPASCFDDMDRRNSINRTNDFLINDFNFGLLKSVVDDETCWRPFKKYISHSRINMNVRQVLYSYENKLP